MDYLTTGAVLANLDQVRCELGDEWTRDIESAKSCLQLHMLKHKERNPISAVSLVMLERQDATPKDCSYLLAVAAQLCIDAELEKN